MHRTQHIVGCLLGGAVGDAIGLPYEGLSRVAVARRRRARPLEHSLVRRRGMLSDDTEHACMTAQALLAARGDPDAFARSLAWRLRGWLLLLPAAVGLGTLRAIIKLWLGWSPHRSGVHSAGNGPAMRAAILGACLGHDLPRLDLFVERSTRLTHTDPRALAGAHAIARAAAAIVHTTTSPLQIVTDLRATTSDPELAAALDLVLAHHARRDPPAVFACSLGQVDGVSGYIHHTVPVALYCWLTAPHDVRAAIEHAVDLGGDTDTVAAIVGGLVGASAGPDDIPPTWLTGLLEAPRTVPWIRRLGESFAAENHRPLPLAWPLLPLRNLVFLFVVLAHGFTRLLRR
jgi:ADP-ribosyl-[dinitrogen reductase] hydrolase